MNSNNIYSDVQFDRPPRPILQNLIFYGGSLVIFTLLWVLIPHSTLYWLLLPVVAIAVWMARQGWRQALFSLHNFIHQLEHHIDGGS